MIEIEKHYGLLSTNGVAPNVDQVQLSIMAIPKSHSMLVNFAFFLLLGVAKAGQFMVQRRKGFGRKTL